YSIFEEILCLASMGDTTTGNNIFHKLNEALEMARLPWEKLASVTTDGAPSMTIRINGLTGRVRKRCKELNTDKPMFLHCINHQESLCRKVAELSDLMSTVVKCVNFIRSRALQHQSQILTRMEEEIRAFKAKLNFLFTKRQTVGGNFTHFPSCREVLDMHKDASQKESYMHYSAKLSDLLKEFEHKVFSRLPVTRQIFKLFANAFTADITTAPDDLQMEIADLQSKGNLRDKFSAIPLQDFYQHIPNDDFPKLTELFAKILSLFWKWQCCPTLCVFLCSMLCVVC
ncbi:GT2D2 protein, partial [Polyodon spathula]|nr:GT2D2 protein [Polyodon spathula]